MRQLISIYQHGYVKDDTFVPVKKVAKDNSDLKEKLLQISGIQINDVVMTNSLGFGGHNATLIVRKYS